MPDGLVTGDRVDDITRLADFLDKQGIKYQITHTEPEKAPRVHTNGEEGDFPKDTKFIYEVPEKDNIDRRTIFTVNLIIKDKGVFKMSCTDLTQRRFW